MNNGFHLLFDNCPLQNGGAYALRWEALVYSPRIKLADFISIWGTRFCVPKWDVSENSSTTLIWAMKSLNLVGLNYLISNWPDQIYMSGIRICGPIKAILNTNLSIEFISLSGKCQQSSISRLAAIVFSIDEPINLTWT